MIRAGPSPRSPSGGHRGRLPCWPARRLSIFESGGGRQTFPEPDGGPYA